MVENRSGELTQDENPASNPATQGRFASKWKSYRELPEEVRSSRPENPNQNLSTRNESGKSTGNDEDEVVEKVDLKEESVKRRNKFIAKARYKLSKAVHAKDCDAGIAAAEDILACNEEVANDLMLGLLQLASDLPGAERFSRACIICGKGNMHLNEYEFASIVGSLMARDAPHAQVRAALNFGLAKDAEPLALVPQSISPFEAQDEEREKKRQSDIKSVFSGAEFDDCGEISDEDDGGAPRALEALGFKTFMKCNGLYKRIEPCPDLLGNDRPVYMKPDGIKGRDVVFAYYWEDTAPEGEGDPDWQSGWYLGSKVGGDGHTYAYLPKSKALFPPTSSKWKIKRPNGSWLETPEYGGFDPPSTSSRAVIVEDEEAREYMEKIDLSLLRGRLVGVDQETSRYFAHFFVLLNLEHMEEIFSFRYRFRYRQAWELVKFGLCFQNVAVDINGTWGTKAESTRMPLPGWPDTGSQFVAFRLPRGMDRERNQIKKGESVLISRGDPLRARVAEGSVKDVDYLRDPRVVIQINGQMPEDPKNMLRFRIDAYANRTTYERQVTALLEFVTQRRSRLCDMLVAAGVGKVDLAVLGADGFAGDKAKLAGSGKDKKDTDAIVETVSEETNEKKEDEASSGVPASQPADDEEDTKDDWSEILKAAGDLINESARSDEAKPKTDVKEEVKGEVKEEGESGDSLGVAAVKVMKESVEGSPQNSDGKDLELLLLPGETKEEATKRRTLAIADEMAEGINAQKLDDAIIEVAALKEVSDTQRDAVLNSMSKRLTIVQGPPGTGKTHTSVRILDFWATNMGYKPLLCTSECNVAVDNIALGLVQRGVKVVRVGRPEKVSEILEPACLDNMVKTERERRREETGDAEDSDEYWEEPEDWESDEWKEWKAHMGAKRAKEQYERKQDAWARSRFLEEAQVICATTIASGSHALSGYKFHGILIDEVAQATETSALVPIVMRGAKQLVLCGDHCQLPPSVQSREAEMRGFSLSLYARLVEAGVPFRFLNTQFRAHPMLMEFSAASIYQGKLLNGIEGSKRPQPKGIPWPDPVCPAAFFECSVEEHLNGESKANQAEATFVANMIKDCLAVGDLKMTDIGVVCPYKGQVRVLRQTLFRMIDGAEESKELEIASVDNFQGREKELIVFSAVRCNKIGSVGFLKDWRRLNVMITRARRGLVVVGNAATLCCDHHWKLWLEFTEKQGGAPPGTVANAMAELRGLAKHSPVIAKVVKRDDSHGESLASIMPLSASEKDAIKKRKTLASIVEQMQEWSTVGYEDEAKKKPKKVVKTVKTGKKAEWQEEEQWDDSTGWEEAPKKKKKKAEAEDWWEEAPVQTKKKKVAHAEQSLADAGESKNYKEESWADLWDDLPQESATKNKKTKNKNWEDEEQWYADGSAWVDELSQGTKKIAKSAAKTNGGNSAGAATGADGEFDWDWADSYGDEEAKPKGKKSLKQAK